VLVDGKVQKDYKLPVGIFDVISVPLNNQQYRVLKDEKGMFYLSLLEAGVVRKLARIENKTVIKAKSSSLTSPTAQISWSRASLRWVILWFSHCPKRILRSGSDLRSAIWPWSWRKAYRSNWQDQGDHNREELPAQSCHHLGRCGV